MARKRPSGRRDISPVTNAYRWSVPDPIDYALPTPFPSVSRAYLSDIAADRTSDPFPDRPRSSRRQDVPLVSKKPSRKVPRRLSHAYELNFEAPRYVVQCVRRKNRREVLFAKKKTGKGSKAKIRRRNAWSSVRC